MKATVTLEITIKKVDRKTGTVVVETVATVPNSGEPIASFPTLFIQEGGSMVLNNIVVEISNV